MLLLWILETAFVALFLVVMLTQFFVPILRGYPAFWVFTKEGRRQKALQDELGRLRREAGLRGLQEKVDEAHRLLDEASLRRLDAMEEQLVRKRSGGVAEGAGHRRFTGPFLTENEPPFKKRDAQKH